MNFIQAENMLKHIVTNAENLISTRKVNPSDFPLELVAIYVFGSYLKKRTLNDLDIIALYNYMDDAEYQHHLRLQAKGVDTFKQAVKKLIEPYKEETVHVQLKPIDYDFKVRQVKDGVPYGKGNSIDRYQLLWFNSEVRL